MDKQKKYSLRKIAGIGLTSCIVGISVMNMPVQAEEGTDAATTAVSETVENTEATSPSESTDETVAANNEATANEASTTAAEQPAVEEEAANPVEEAASQPSETEEVAPAAENIDAQPSNGEAAEANDKSNQLDSNDNSYAYNSWYISQYDKNKGELGSLKGNLTVDGKPYDYFNLVGYEGEVVTPELINETIDKLGGTESIIPDGYQFERKIDQTYTIHEGQSKEIVLNLVRTNPSHEKVEYKFISKIYTGYNNEYVGVYNFVTIWPEKGSFITGNEIDDNIRNNYLWPYKNETPIDGWYLMLTGPVDDSSGPYAGKNPYYYDSSFSIFNNLLQEINLSKSDNRDDRDGRFLTVNIYKDKQLLRSIRISGYLGDTAQPDDIAKALNDLKMPEGYTFKGDNNTAYQVTGTFNDRQTLTYNIVPVHPSTEKGEFTITIKDKNGKVYGQKNITEPKGTAITTFEINNIAMELKEAATFPTGTDIQPYDLFAGKPYYYVGKDVGYDYILNSVSKESNNTPSTDNKDSENNQNNTNGNGTTQPENTNNENGQTNTGGNTNNQTGENGTATNQKGNTSQNSNNNDKGQKPSKSDNSQFETTGLSRLAARKAKEDLPKAGMKENSLALLGFALFALTGGVSAKRVFRKK